MKFVMISWLVNQLATGKDGISIAFGTEEVICSLKIRGCLDIKNIFTEYYSNKLYE